MILSNDQLSQHPPPQDDLCFKIVDSQSSFHVYGSGDFLIAPAPASLCLLQNQNIDSRRIKSNVLYDCHPAEFSHQNFLLMSTSIQSWYPLHRQSNPLLCAQGFCKKDP
jgi:hypothetical protein